ncbi:FAD dependent oxidoreductase-domain-containing protein [Mycena floridula]|nr:FAD dependent oxidoreductase-domain-containing protein [Mycena floridula]
MEYSPASLPVPNPTASFWLDSPGASPLATEGSTGPLTKDADICIIGSGITGVSAAYHLAKLFANDTSRPPIKATILEARNFCSGATGRNGGNLIPFTFLNFRALEAAHGATQALKSAALERYTTREMINIIEEHKFDVDLVRGGIIAVARDTEEFEGGKQDIEAAKAAGLQIDDVEWIDEARLKEVYGLTSSFPAVRLTSGNTV